MGLSKEQKKALKKAYEANERKNYVLSKREAAQLFEYLEEMLDEEGCDHTLRFTKEWLSDNIDAASRISEIVNEITEDGGYCDCEVILNCYEDYELD